MKFKEKLKKIFKYSLLPITMAIALIILFTTNAYAYYIEDGVIYSENLFSLDNFKTYGSINYSTNETGFRITGSSSINWNRYVYKTIALENGTYTLSFDQSPLTTIYIYDGNTQIFGDGQTQLSHMTITFNVSGNSNIYFRWYTNSLISNIMLNTGSSAKTYLPYGNYVNSELYNNSVWANAFNGQNVNVYNTNNINNLNSSTLIYTEQLTSQNNNFMLPNSTGTFIENYVQNALGCYSVELAQPVQFTSLTFHRIDEINVDFHIYLYFQDNTSEVVIMPASSDYDRRNIIWTNNNLKYLTKFIIECEFGYSYVDKISLPNSAIVYNNGYETGYDNGYQDGKYAGINAASTEAYQQGFAIGKQQGLNEGLNQGNTLYGMVMAIVDAPINIFKNIFDFDVLGINLVNLTFSIITLIVTIFLIKKIR